MARTNFPSDKQDQFMIRFPDGMRDRLKRLADLNDRSMNAEIVARLKGVLSSDEEGWVRLWLPSDLIERIEAKAASSQSTAEVEARLALEEAFPYVPTLRDYIRRMRLSVMEAGENADPAFRAFVEASERQLDEHPELGERPLETPLRGTEVGPE